MAVDGSDVVVDRRGARRLGVLLDDGALEVVVDMHLRDGRGADVRQVEVARLLAEARPARRDLAVDRDRRTAVIVLEVEDVEPEPRVRREDRVLARDDRHRERQQPILRRRDVLEVGRERPVRVHVPDREEAGRGRHALDGRDQLLAVLAEHDVARGAGGPCRGRRLVQAERAEGVRDRAQTGLLVNLVATTQVVSNAYRGGAVCRKLT